MSVLVVVQARTGSTRFPGKVLAELAGQPMLAFMLDRLAPISAAPSTSLVVATSDLPADDVVAELAATKGVRSVRGSEADVLRRFALAAEELPAEDVVRLTADCPLIDPAVVLQIVERHRETGADYTSNTLARTFPDGLDVEVMTSAALRWADENAACRAEREHVTPFLQRHPERIQIAQVIDPAQAGYERWTIDRPDDLALVQDAVRSVRDPRSAGWHELLDAVGRRAQVPPTALWPVESVPHVRGAPYHRAWRATCGAGPCGSASAWVRQGGTATLEVEGADPSSVERAVHERLAADLQVTEVVTTTGGAESA